MHPCVLQDLPMTFQAFQPQDLPKALQLLQLLQRHSRHSSHSWPSSLPRQFYNVPVSPGNPPHSSILRLECIFYIFYNSYSSIGFHRNSTEYQLGNYRHYKHSFFKEREMLRYRSNWQILQNRIISSFVLSSDNTNCKNDIQLFHQLFDELSVHTDYH